jgi:hypothetical protein
MSNAVRSIARRSAAVKSNKVVAVPETIAANIAQSDARIMQLQQDLQTVRLVRENQILSAALELGLNKADMAELEIAVEPGGRRVFRSAAKPAKFKKP